MNYINTTTNQYPVSEQEIRQQCPNTSFATPFAAPEEFAVVFPAPPPDYNSVIQMAREIAPELTVKGTWEQRWEVVSRFTEYTDEEGVLHTVVEQEASALSDKLLQDRSFMWEQIKLERDRRAHGGGYALVGKWFHSDTFSRSQQLGLVLMGADIPAGLMWKTMDGTFIEMTQSLANNILVAAGVADTLTFSHAEALKTQVDASENPRTVDIYQGWPVCFLDLQPD